METALIGRAAELEMLAERARRAARGYGGVVLLAGEAGIGKSRLLHEFAAGLGSGRATVAACACDEFGSEALAPIVTLSEKLKLQSPVAIDKAIVQMLVERSTHGNLVLIVDDVQWAAETTLKVLSTIGRAAEGHRILLVIAYRNDDLGEERPALLYLARMGRLPMTLSMTLGPLRGADVKRLIRAAATDCRPSEISEMARRSDGNPADALALAAASVGGGGADSLATAQRARALKQVQNLTARQRRIVQCAAAIGMRFDAQLLAEVSDEPLDEVFATLRTLRDSRIVDELGGEPSTFGFRRVLTREAIAASMLNEEVRRLRRRADEAIATTGFGARAARDAESNGRHAEAAELHERLLMTESEPTAIAARLERLADALAKGGDFRLASRQYERCVSKHVDAGSADSAASTFNAWAVVAIASGDCRRALAIGEALAATPPVRHALISLRAHLGIPPSAGEPASPLWHALAGDRAAFRLCAPVTDLDFLDACVGAYTLGIDRTIVGSESNRYVQAVDILESIRRGELAQARRLLDDASTDASPAESLTPLHAAAALWLWHFCGDEEVLAPYDLSHIWAKTVESGQIVSIGALAAPYARRLFALDEVARASAVLDAACDALGTHGVFFADMALVAAEYGQEHIVSRFDRLVSNAGPPVEALLPIRAATRTLQHSARHGTAMATRRLVRRAAHAVHIARSGGPCSKRLRKSLATSRNARSKRLSDAEHTKQHAASKFACGHAAVRLPAV